MLEEAPTPRPRTKEEDRDVHQRASCNKTSDTRQTFDLKAII